MRIVDSIYDILLEYIQCCNFQRALIFHQAIQ